MDAAQRRHLIFSGLPGSGKSTLARRLAPMLDLPVLDKDDFLEQLFDAKGVGDTASRRALSRESDQQFQTAAMTAPRGALLVSFWHLPGMPSDSGTPTRWLSDLSGCLLHIHCSCPPEIAAMRYAARTRHRGHLDVQASNEDILKKIDAIAQLGPLDLKPTLDVDTSRTISADRIAREITEALTAIARR